MLTKEQAIKECKELWTEIKESGLSKYDFLGTPAGRKWREKKYKAYCPLCTYAKAGCSRCPLPEVESLNLNPRGQKCFELGYSGRYPPTPRWLEVIRNLGGVPLKVGDKVKIKDSIERPCHGWGMVTRYSIGVISKVCDDGEYLVKFPEQAGWLAGKDELELVKEEPKKQEPKFKVGDVVQILPELSHPYGASINGGDIGIVETVDKDGDYWVKFQNGLWFLGDNQKYPSFKLCPKQIVYKEVRIKDGKYVSIRAGEFDKGEQVTYKVGAFIYSPTSDGLFCYNDQETAIGDAKRHFNFPLLPPNFYEARAAVLKLEAYGQPIISQSKYTSFIAYTPRYPAVKVLGVEWEEQPETKPKSFEKEPFHPNMLLGNNEDWELRNEGRSVMLYFKGKMVGQFCFMGTEGFSFFDRTIGNREITVSYDDKNLG